MVPSSSSTSSPSTSSFSSSTSSLHFGATLGNSTVSSCTVLSLNPLQIAASSPSFHVPPNPIPSNETQSAQNINRAVAHTSLHTPPPPPNVSLPPPPPLLASNSEPVLLQSLSSLPAAEAFLPPSSTANSALSIKLASLQHKTSRPSFTVHHPPLPRLPLAKATPGIPQSNAAGTPAMWVTLGVQSPYASHLSGVKPR